MDALGAAARLGVSRARLYQLRTDYLKDKPGYQPKASGGDRREDWPSDVIGFLNGFLPECHGLPEAIYTDALSLFGPSSSNHHADPRSEFQRALRALHVAHLVAPTPQAKGKIERSFRTFQNRLVTLMSHAGVSDWKSADSILQMEIRRQNGKTQRSTGRIPSEVWEEQLLKRSARLRLTPTPTLLDSSLFAAGNVQGPHRALHRIQRSGL